MPRGKSEYEQNHGWSFDLDHLPPSLEASCSDIEGALKPEWQPQAYKIHQDLSEPWHAAFSFLYYNPNAPLDGLLPALGLTFWARLHLRGCFRDDHTVKEITGRGLYREAHLSLPILGPFLEEVDIVPPATTVPTVAFLLTNLYAQPARTYDPPSHDRLEPTRYTPGPVHEDPYRLIVRAELISASYVLEKALVDRRYGRIDQDERELATQQRLKETIERLQTLPKDLRYI